MLKRVNYEINTIHSNIYVVMEGLDPFLDDPFLEMEMILITLSILSLPLMAVCYFYTRFKLCIIFALIFYVSNVMFSYSLLYENHIVFFYLLMAPCVAFPVSCLIAFAFDVKYAIFCIDTSFATVIAWVFSPILLPINLVILCLGN